VKQGFLALGGAATLLALGCGGKTTDSGGAGGGSGASSAASAGGSAVVGVGGAQSVAVGEGVGFGVGVGGAAIGGSGGVGHGVTYCDPVVGYPDPIATVSPIISDFESGPLVQAVQSGSIWGVASDGMGTDSMTIEPCGINGMGMRFSGKGHTVWGTVVGAALVNPKQPVDVDTYLGLRFSIRSAFDSPMILKIENPYSQPVCGRCDDTVVGAECYSGYFRNLILPSNVTVQEAVPWSEFAQMTWGYKAPGTAMFDPWNLVSITFAFDRGVDFDVCIDDVAFMK
jgi:hypothetical protein